ncbi:MAG: hypothetical protein WCY32_04780 [Burkholderiaceae bacterium]
MPDGSIRFLEPLPEQANRPLRVFVTFTEPVDEALSGLALSAPALAQDWLREDEDAAWEHLQAAQ